MVVLGGFRVDFVVCFGWFDFGLFSCWFDLRYCSTFSLVNGGPIAFASRSEVSV